MDFTGKVALITGAGSGIGRAVALKLSSEGALLVLCDINEDSLHETVTELDATSAPPVLMRVDVTDESSVSAAVAAARGRFGGLDLSVNNAGISQPHKTVARLDVADWRRTLDVNLTGVFLCMKHEIPLMVERGKGAIVNVASALGVIGAIRASAYVAAKHGVLGLTKSAALEFAEAGVRVNAVCPGMTETPLIRVVPEAALTEARNVHAMRRFAQPAEVADVILYLLSSRASFVTGAHYLVDGGWTAH